jgi:aryl-alcohol dehydrogenase-like predicted oxidoreductase
MIKIALGTMTWGDTTEKDEARRIFRRALDEGVTVFDTADVYSDGIAETWLGEFIRETNCRNDITVATKGGYRGIEHSMGDYLDRSLDRLGLAHVDIYYFHRFGDFHSSLDLDETIRSQYRGQIKHIGVSNCAAWQVGYFGQGVIEYLQPMYSLLKRQAEVELFPYAKERELQAYTYSPLGAGMLSGEKHGRLSTNERYQRRYAHESYPKTVDRFLWFARDGGYDPAALAIAWAASHPQVDAAIVGPRTLDQFSSCIGATQIGMTPELRAEISALSPTPPPATDRLEEM